jgi:putative ABC transport system permease protein
MRALLRALALLAVPRDWRETVRHDLTEEVGRADSKHLSTPLYLVEAVRIGITLRCRALSLSAISDVVSILGSLPFDVRLAVRALRRSPWFAATIVGVMTLVLTLAIVVFATVDGVLFRPLPYPDSDRLFMVEAGVAGFPRPEESLASASAVDLEHWSAAAPYVAFTGYQAARWSGLGTGVNDDTAAMADVRPEFFRVLGAHPMMGGFSAGHFESEARISPVVITWDLWQGRFGGRADIIGHVEYFRGTTDAGVRVVGVMPRGFWFPSTLAEVQFIRPQVLTAEQLTNPARRSFTQIIARTPVGMTPEALRSRIEAGMRATAAVFSDRGPRPEGWSEAFWRREGPFDLATVRPLGSSLGRRSQTLFRGIFAAAMVLVLLGALNASALLAARAVDRQREIGVRRALGASRSAVAQTVAIEVLVLFLAAAGLALPLAPPLLHIVLPLLPENIVLFKPWGAQAFDWRVFAFAGSLAAVLAMQASIWPIRRAVRAAPATAGVAGRASEPRSRGRFIVVASQVAGALTLTVLGALLVGSLLSVYGQGLSVRTDGIVYIEARIWGPRPPADAAERNARVSPLLERLRAVPGVREVTLVSGQTLFGPWPDNFVTGLFRGPDNVRAYRSPHTHAVTPGYYQMLQPQVVAGRVPTDAELGSGAPVMVISERLAKAYWPDENPLGHELRARWNQRTYEVIGVVRDVPWLSWDTATPTAYGPYASLDDRSSTVTLFIDTAGPPARVTRGVLDELERMTPAVTAERAGNLGDIFADTIAVRRFRSWLFGGFAVAALTVVGVGVLGLLAMSTARRTREIGIRQALGATRASIVRLFVREQLRPVLAGLAIGVGVSAWAVRFVESYLFGVTATDPRVWGLAIGLILLTAVVGALVPSVRASGTDPTVALRTE